MNDRQQHKHPVNANSPRVLIACLGDGARVPRAVRFTRQLTSAGFDVTVASNAQAHEQGKSLHFSVKEKLDRGITRRLDRFGWFAPLVPDVADLREQLHTRRYGLSEFATLLGDQCFDVILVQDLALLPAVLRNSNGASIIFDAREYYPLQNEESRRFLRFEAPERRRLCAQWLPKTDAVITVSDGIAARYSAEFDINPVVVLSASEALEITPHSASEGLIRLVHHGVANQNRNLFYLFELMKQLPDRFTLDLYLVSASTSRIDSFRRAAENQPRISLHDPVPFDTLVYEISAYDIGVHLLSTENFNLRHAMPNKLFEFVQARLAVAVGPSPDMAAFVRAHRCGVVAEAPTVNALAKALQGLSTDEITRMKFAADAAARTVTAAGECSKLIGLIKRLTRPTCTSAIE